MTWSATGDAPPDTGRDRGEPGRYGPRHAMPPINAVPTGPGGRVLSSRWQTRLTPTEAIRLFLGYYDTGDVALGWHLRE